MPKTSELKLDLVHLARLFTPEELAARIGHAVHSAQTAREVHAMEAVRAGILAILAKRILPHGDFQAWAVKNVTVTFFGGKLSYETLHRYMRAATAFAQQTAMKPKSSAFLDVGAEESRGAMDQFREVVRAWIDGRSLTKIYIDNGILRERDPHQQHTPAGKDPEKKVQLELGLVIETWQGIRSNLVVQTSTGGWEILPKADRLAFLEDALPAVGNLALNTPWTPAERIAIHQRLVNITTQLASGKGGK